MTTCWSSPGKSEECCWKNVVDRGQGFRPARICRRAGDGWRSSNSLPGECTGTIGRGRGPIIQEPRQRSVGTICAHETGTHMTWPKAILTRRRCGNAVLDRLPIAARPRRSYQASSLHGNLVNRGREVGRSGRPAVAAGPLCTARVEDRYIPRFAAPPVNSGQAGTPDLLASGGRRWDEPNRPLGRIGGAG